MQIRAEQAADVAAVHQLHQTAFGGSGEADLVDRLRGLPDTLSLVAIAEGQIIGHVFFSPVTVQGSCAGLMLGLAPVAVLPDFQRRGVGSQLIRQGLQACAQAGCRAVVVLGWPQYYPRFGFVPAKTKGLSCEYAVPDEAFMVLELQPGALQGCQGMVHYRPEFNQLE